MDTSQSPPRPCAHCGARLRPGDAWCSLCYRPTGETGAAPEEQGRQEKPEKEPEESRAAVPLQRQAPPPPAAGALVGGEVPAELMERLTTALAAESALDGVAVRRVPRPAVLAGGGAAVLVLVLVVVMTVIGRLL